MARYAKAEIHSEDGETVVRARFDTETLKWQVTIAGPVTNAANRAELQRQWEQTLQTTTDQLRETNKPGPAQGAPWAYYFAETCLSVGLEVSDPVAPGKPPAEPLEY